STLSRSWPARPTNGRPVRSSSSPGASPMSMKRASSGPSPNTRLSDRSFSAGALTAAPRSSSRRFTRPLITRSEARDLAVLQRLALAPDLAPQLGLEADHEEEVLQSVLPPLDLGMGELGAAGDERQRAVLLERLGHDLGRGQRGCQLG